MHFAFKYLVMLRNALGRKLRLIIKEKKRKKQFLQNFLLFYTRFRNRLWSCLVVGWLLSYLILHWKLNCSGNVSLLKKGILHKYLLFFYSPIIISYSVYNASWCFSSLIFWYEIWYLNAHNFFGTFSYIIRQIAHFQSNHKE